LLTYMSMGMGAGPAGSPQAASQATPEKKESSGNVVSKGLGGMLSMGRKKKKDDSEQEQSKEAAAPAGAAGSLMDMTVEVTSFSTSAVDSGLFAVPADFKQVQPKKGEVQ
jgi:hypothetical protein